MLSRCHRHKLSATNAFGLVELVVSIGIMAIVISVVVTRQSSFNGAVLLRNQAYELAFAIRQAQLLAVSGGDASVRTYGVYVDTADAEQHKYILFQDNVTKNNRYDSGEQIGLTGTLDKRFEIRGITYGGGAMAGSSITFTRPNFDANFCSRSACNLTGPVNIDIARTGVTTNGTGDVRRVEITGTGQITVVTY